MVSAVMVGNPVINMSKITLFPMYFPLPMDSRGIFMMDQKGRPIVCGNRKVSWFARIDAVI